MLIIDGAKYKLLTPKDEEKSAHACMHEVVVGLIKKHILVVAVKEYT